MTAPLLPDYASIIDQLGIDDHDGLRSVIKPAMYACYNDSDTDQPLGASRFGGLPDLPIGVDWPVCEAGPIPFVSQVNLSELPGSAGRELLPERGMLYFFYGNPEGDLFFPNDEEGVDGGTAVLFAEDSSNLKRAETPAGFDEEYVTRARCQLLHFHGCNTFVDWEHPFWKRYDREFGPDIPKLETPWKDQRPRFQILGHSQPMQSSICHYVADDTLSSDSDQQEAFIDWSLGLETLFQAIDVEGDCSLYFMIQRDDLLARRWGKYRWTLQCT